MTRIPYVALAVGLLGGCFPPSSGGPQTVVVDCTASNYQVDTGATIDHAAGVDAGYYVSYGGGGQWHIEWTCDTKLSAEGCNFTGTITTPAGATATGYQLEADDALTVTPGASQTTITFDTVTSSGIDGVDITTTPGTTIDVDFQINGIYQNDLVFLPSGGAATAAQCMPTGLTPSSP